MKNLNTRLLKGFYDLFSGHFRERSFGILENSEDHLGIETAGIYNGQNRPGTCHPKSSRWLMISFHFPFSFHKAITIAHSMKLANYLFETVGEILSLANRAQCLECKTCPSANDQEDENIIPDYLLKGQEELIFVEPKEHHPQKMINLKLWFGHNIHKPKLRRGK